MSHEITPLQREDAHEVLGVGRIVEVPSKWWGQIPAEEESVCDYTAEIERWLKQEAKAGDMLLVQGDFGATVRMVQFARDIGVIPVYATTNRVSKEVVDGDRVTTVREFRHVRFRRYETECKKDN